MLALALVLAGCTQFGPYRAASLDVQPSKPVALKPAECWSGARPAAPPAGTESLAPCEPPPAAGVSAKTIEDVGRASIQHRHYVYRGSGDAAPRRHGEYDLAFVEFDDQGWFEQRGQMEALFMRLRQIEVGARAPENGHVLILVYVHGWKHNASQCDDNVICFSRLLERMDILERELRDEKEPRRQVVGVYVGWRGLSLDAGILSNVTFWTRKATAERVGRGGVTELFSRLDDYRHARNPGREDDKTQLVVAGHSFGGLVLYSALAHSLMERAVHVGGTTCGPAAAPGPTAPCYATARSFGDLVVLVNPAFEGSLYEPLFHITTNRCYGPEQRPVMLTVTSSADAATGTAFPLGRSLNTRFEHARSADQNDSIRQAVGHDARYQTHALKWTGPPGVEPRAAADTACGCRHLEPTQTFAWWEFAKSVQRVLAQPGAPAVAGAREVPPPVKAHPGKTRMYDFYGDNVQLEGDAKYSANYPYLVVKADGEIIKDHNSIYSEPFIRFLHAFFLVHIAAQRPFEATGPFEAAGCARDIEACAPGGRIPCEASCQLPLPGGGSCSGRSLEDLRR